MDNETGVQNQFQIEPRSESKISVGQKRAIPQSEETSESPQKRVKLGDLENAKSSKAQDGMGGSNTANPDVNSGSGALDLNVNAAISIHSADELHKVLNDANEVKNRGFDLDLNAEDISSSVNDPFYPYKNYGHLKSRDDSECASSVGSLDYRDSMKVWKGLKQNNYMSTSYGNAMNAIPKPRGRKKSNNDGMKRMELAKKEQVDRFAKVAAPSGLLNGLNPGIINHVRNRKQVHAIIDALVRSERTENQQSGNKDGNQNQREDSGDVLNLGMNHRNVMLERRQMGIPAPLNEQNYLNPEFTGGYDDSHSGQMRVSERIPSQYPLVNKDDGLYLKLSPSVMVASESTSCLSNEESGSLTNVDSLSVKAANVALQWLELLNQDIKGRLAALRRSKKRVQAVITKELPLLLSREFSSNVENDSYTSEGSSHCHFDKASINAHAARWNALFGQMDQALSEEANRLESWLHQLNEMHSHCGKGLCRSHLYHGSQETGLIENNRLRDAENISDEELAVRAAAASIYSTCSYLMSMENQPSCC